MHNTSPHRGGARHEPDPRPSIGRLVSTYPRSAARRVFGLVVAAAGALTVACAAVLRTYSAAKLRRPRRLSALPRLRRPPPSDVEELKPSPWACRVRMADRKGRKPTMASLSAHPSAMTTSAFPTAVVATAVATYAPKANPTDTGRW